MNPDLALAGAAALADCGAIRACGADAASFLHGQLTSDITSLGLSQARLAGYCSPKGRLLASFVVWKMSETELMLACGADTLPATLKRLQMFVLRAKCQLSDASPEVQLYGLVGTAADTWLGNAAPSHAWGKAEHAGCSVIRLPDAAGKSRYLCASESAPPLPPLSLDLWHWLEVRSGVARIQHATTEQFVPQMLNYELLGGVDFGKGCYPGQEVVARSHYRGTLKRRSFLFELDGLAAAGQEVFHSEDPAQPAGQVVNAAPHPPWMQAGGVALVELKLAALSSGSLHLASPSGPELRRIDLPYAVPLER